MIRGSDPPGRFQDPDQIAEAIVSRVGKRIVLALPLGLGKANHIANALYARAAADPSIHLRIFTALTLERPRPRNELQWRFTSPLSGRLFGGYPDLVYSAAQRAGRLPPNIEVDEFFFLAGSRLNVPAAQQSYISANYTHVLGYVIERGVNVIGQLVARGAGGESERFSLSCNPDITLDLLAARREGRCNFVLAGQVNTELPYMLGDADLPAGEFDFVLDSPQTDFTLFAPPRESIGNADYAAGLHVARTVVDGGTLQIGIGSLGDALAQALILRHRRNAEFRTVLSRLDSGSYTPTGLRNDSPFDLGLYGLSEMFVEGFLDLMRAGVLKREVDGALLQAEFFLGSRAFYRALREMPDAERAKLRMTAVSYVNELYGDEAAKRRTRVKARFVNNAMMVTLLGAVVSDALEDGRVVSGVGGQYNFVAQAFALADARSVIMLRSTRRADRKTVSNIRWTYGNTTIPRHLRDIVVTEYGVADLRGRSDRDVIAAMLAIADSRFQGELLRQARDAGKIEKEFELPAACRDNTPERISRALKPAIEQGLLPPFPFGTDFTPVEQRLMPALGRLRNAPPLQLARIALRGLLASRPGQEVRDCLARMALDQPKSLRERLYAALLRGALG